MKLAKYFLVAALNLSGPLAHAGASGLEFSAEEIARNKQNSFAISQTASACLHRKWDEHLTFYSSHGYSKFYGNRNPKHNTTDGRKLVLLKILRPQLFSEADKRAIEQQKIITLTGYENYIRDVNVGAYQEIQRIKPELSKRENELVASSCIGMTMACLSEAMQANGMSETWKKIYAYVAKNNNFYGTDLQKALVDLGWKSLYWNPDPSQNNAWDQEDRIVAPLQAGRVWNPIWGGHAEMYNSVMRKKIYYGIPVTDSTTLVGFGTQVPATFKKVPFFIGTAHSGYHVFPGTKGLVIEAHSMRALSSRDNLEFGNFNPLDQQNGGGPRWTNIEHYRSGMIVVPPLSESELNQALNIPNSSDNSTNNIPDTNSDPAQPNSGSNLCSGTFSGKFASGEKAAVVIREDGSFALRARGEEYSASGSCSSVSSTKATVSFNLDDDANYSFTGEITVGSDQSKSLNLVQRKSGRQIDKLILKQSR